MRHAKMLTVRHVLATLVGVVLLHQPAATGQIPSLEPGDIVRTATADSASNGFWMKGTVLSFSSDSLILSDTDGLPLVRLNESIRVQINRGRDRKTALGGVLGAFVGFMAGVLSVKTDYATSQSESAGVDAIFQYGALAAVVGAAVGSRFGPTRWEEVPIGSRAALAASLPVSGVDQVDVVNVEWWRRLEIEPVDIARTLELHAADLAPIEGIWEHLGDAGVSAIVRESRYDGIDYVAYAPSGRIVAAVNGQADDTAYHVRFPPSTTQYPALLAEGVLTLRSPGDTVRQWIKRSAAVDSTFLVLSQGVTLLTPVVVEAPRIDQRLRDVGFNQRRQALAGTFLTREDIIQQNPRNTAELLRRIPGFYVDGAGNVSAPRDVCGGAVYFIDGIHSSGNRLSFVLPDAIAGMEVYNSAAAVPLQYHIAGNPRCGVILIWTLDGGTRP